MSTVRGRQTDETRRLFGHVRKMRVAEMIRSRGFMSSADLAAAFGVSEMTIRRDLAELDGQGELMRTHGGAVARDQRSGEPPPVVEPLYEERTKRGQREKARIAAAAERMVLKGQAVALDTGTTTFELAASLASRTDIRIFTNNLRIGQLLGSHPVETYMLGGRVRHNEMSLCGPVAAQQARQLRFDTAFIGVSALGVSGVHDFSIDETEIKRIFMEQATHRVVLCDSSKFDGVALVQVARLDEFDTLITDAPPPPALAKALEEASVSVIVAPE